MPRQLERVMLSSIDLFCLSADLESFAAAARVAGLTPAAVSRSIARLEERLQVRLFVRTTRQIRLTDGGRAYLAHCKAALNQLQEAERELTGQQSDPSGVVRISVPTTFGQYCLLPLLPAFRAKYPHIQIEVQLSNRNIDFVSDCFDLAVRAREQADSGLIARHLMDGELVVVAAPTYLKKQGTPKTLTDLQEHDCIQFILPSSGQRVPWSFKQDGKDVELATQGNITCLDDILACVTLARAGGGLVQTYRFIVGEDLQQGRLVEVLKKSSGRSRPFSLMYLRDRHMPQRVRVFVDYLVQAFA
mgnify:CR=1 FL=1